MSISIKMLGFSREGLSSNPYEHFNQNIVLFIWNVVTERRSPEVLSLNPVGDGALNFGSPLDAFDIVTEVTVHSSLN
ncbi:hypothetical protein BgiBS90_014681, partial [Biomphalaria glabrata]